MNKNKNIVTEFLNDFVSTHNKAVLITRKGYGSYLKNDFNNAIRLYNEALNIENNLIQAVFYRGRSYYQLELYEESSQDFGQLIKILTDDHKLPLEELNNLSNDNKIKNFLIESYFNLGVCYINLKKFKDAIECFSNTIYFDEKYWSAYYYRGNARISIDTFIEIKNAIVDYTEVLNINRNYRMANFLRGFCYAHLGENEIAYLDWKLANEAGLTENNEKNWLRDYFD